MYVQKLQPPYLAIDYIASPYANTPACSNEPIRLLERITGGNMN